MNGQRTIPLHRPTMRGKEYAYIREVLEAGEIGGGGKFTRRVEAALAAHLGGGTVFLTHSCTAALEIAAMLTVSPGDEVILPSFTFAAAGTAFARSGATLVFVDIDRDTFNIDPAAVEAALTPRTRVIMPMHYAGVACRIPELQRLAREANVVLVEDSAHAFGAKHQGRALGSFGSLAAFSFQATKNVTSGEGGALIVNDAAFVERAQIIRDRGTNREQFVQHRVSEYSWIDLGSAYAPSEIVAALLLPQIEDVEAITARRLELWHTYHAAFEALEGAGVARRPVVPPDTAHNAHIYHLVVAEAARGTLLNTLRQQGISAALHYVPLHSAPAGRKFGRASNSLAVTEDIARRLIRLPLHLSLTDDDQQRVIDVVTRALRA